MINDVSNYRVHNDWSSLPDEMIKVENMFIDVLSKLGLRVGLADPLMKVYIQPKPVETTPFILFAATYQY